MANSKTDTKALETLGATWAAVKTDTTEMKAAREYGSELAEHMTQLFGHTPYQMKGIATQLCRASDFALNATDKNPQYAMAFKTMQALDKCEALIEKVNKDVAGASGALDAARRELLKAEEEEKGIRAWHQANCIAYKVTHGTDYIDQRSASSQANTQPVQSMAAKMAAMRAA